MLIYVTLGNIIIVAIVIETMPVSIRNENIEY